MLLEHLQMHLTANVRSPPPRGPPLCLLGQLELWPVMDTGKLRGVYSGQRQVWWTELLERKKYQSWMILRMLPKERGPPGAQVWVADSDKANQGTCPEFPAAKLSPIASHSHRPKTWQVGLLENESFLLHLKLKFRQGLNLKFWGWTNGWSFPLRKVGFLWGIRANVSIRNSHFIYYKNWGNIDIKKKTHSPYY